MKYFFKKPQRIRAKFLSIIIIIIYFYNYCHYPYPYYYYYYLLTYLLTYLLLLLLLLLLLFIISNSNRTEWSPICLITSMITSRIGRHEVLLPINHNFTKICDIIGYF